MRVTRPVFAAVAVVFGLGMLSCEPPTELVNRGLHLSWSTPLPETINEGDAASATVELRDVNEQPARDFDGASVQVRFRFERDSQPGTACGVECTFAIAEGRTQMLVAWVSAGTWTVRACIRPANPADSLCAERPLVVEPVHAWLSTFPTDSVGRRARFPIEARLRLPDGTAVTTLAPLVRLRFIGGGVRCPDAGPVCLRPSAAGVARWDSVMVTDAARTTVQACAIAPNGHERCDPAGGRQFRVVPLPPVPRFIQHPADGFAGVPLGRQPIIALLEPDGTRRTDFVGLVRVSLVSGIQPAEALAGTGSDGATSKGKVLFQAPAGLVSPTDLRISAPGAGYRLVASVAGATPDTSAAFDVSLDGSRLTMSIHAGDGQWAMMNTLVPVDPAVRITGPLGDGVPGVVTSWASIGLGGHGFLGTVTTDADGVASHPWQLNHGVQTDYLWVSADGVGELLFEADGVVPTKLAFTTQPSDVLAGEVIQPAVVIELQDDQSRRVWNADWLLELRAGTLEGTVERHAQNGRAVFDNLSITSAGEKTIGAFVAHTIGQTSSATFVVRPLAASLITVVSGDGQVAPPGTTVLPPVVQVQDVYHNRISGRSVTFAATRGGGTVLDAVQVSNEYGFAQPGSWTLGSSEGTNELTVAGDGLEPALITATGQREPVVVTKLQFITTPIATAGEVVAPIVVELLDAQGRRAFTNTTVSIKARNCYPDANGECDLDFDAPNLFTGSTSHPAVDGLATFDGLLITSAGRKRLIASLVSGPRGDTSFLVRPSTVAALAADPGDFPIGTVNMPLFAVPSVRLVDTYLNTVPEAGVTVMFSVAPGGGAITGSIQVTDTTGHARPNSWTLGPNPGVHTLFASAAGIPGTTLSATANAPIFETAVLSAGYDFTCATSPTNLPYCWGDNSYGQLGDGTLNARNRPNLLAAGFTNMTQISAGLRYACGLRPDGVPYCWGDNSYGQLGTGTRDSSWTPALVSGSHTFQQVVTGAGHTCGLDPDALAWCWGAWQANGLPADTIEPVRVIGLHEFTQIVAGSWHTCGLTASGQAWCWGDNTYGQLGDNDVPFHTHIPVLVDGGRTFTHLAAGSIHTCGISAGAVYCWGSNGYGQLGTGGTSFTPVYAPVASLGVLGTAYRLTAGGGHTCAVTLGLDGPVDTYCWGLNDHGQLGDATTTNRTSGTLVTGATPFAKLTAGYSHTCGTQVTGASYCWGWSYLGRLGIGTFGGADVKVPTPVVVP